MNGEKLENLLHKKAKKHEIKYKKIFSFKNLNSFKNSIEKNKK